MTETREVYRKLGSTGLRCHMLGFGCYRIAAGDEVHEAALVSYLERGGNLIDTSANYGDGLSETLVGQVLAGRERGKVLVVTKGGYIQGQNMELARRRNFPETVYYGEGIWHSIHPDFLETQVERSLERMRLGKIDVYLLHNPEYFLTEKEHHGGPTPADHEEFYRRIRAAFRFLESQVERGSIDWYGVSSNNFGLPPSNRTMTSVARCLQQARAVRDDHHFRVVQLPMNLYESGGALVANNHGRSVLEFCREEGLGVLVNRPLNAFSGRRMIRLADFVKPGEKPPGREALREILAPLGAHEARLGPELGVELAGGGDKGLAALVEEIVPRLESPAHWEQAAGPYVIRPLQAWLRRCQEKLAHDMRWQAWQLDFIQLCNTTFERVSRFLATREQALSDRVRKALQAAGHPESRETLSRMALNVLASLPGLDCVLCGMRRTEYVADAMGVAEMTPVEGLGILSNFQP